MRRGILTPVAVVTIAVASGGWLLQRGVERVENVYVKIRLLQEVVDRVESSYVDEVDQRRLYNSAIEGLISDLGDPHSSFLEASDYEDLRIRTEGDYGGVGLEVIDRNGWVTVVSPIPGTPAARAGVRPGDQFFSIDGVAADTMDTDQAVELLRGRPGSTVSVQMLRPGVEEPIPFTLERAVVRLKAVPFALMLDQGVGYVPFQTVRETSSAEIRAAVDSLREEGMRGLVLDVRGNPGGLLDQGIAVSDLFLESGLTIVETRGRAADQSATYDASRPDRYADLPVVVLADGASASASEIIAGALQDHDRALVVGESTFGKGSVQSLYRLTGGNVLRLTTARWHTPVGRSIEKDHTEPIALTEDIRMTLSGQPTRAPDLEERPIFESRSGRTLYGGGGITPDVHVTPETLTGAEEDAVRQIYRQGGAFNVALFNFAVRYVQEHPELKPGFELTSDDLDAFYRALPEWDVEVARGDFRRARRFITYQLEREIALQEWGQEAEFLQTRDQDRPLVRALELLRDASDPQSLVRSVPAPRVEGSPGS